jgi:ribonuclease P protein component
MNEKFGKEYKLCSQKVIQSIFDEKKSVKAYPFLIHYSLIPLSSDASFQITVSAPKRNFKKAHDRNRIKRLMREAIRKNKLILEPLLLENGQQLALFMVYIAREELSLDFLQKKTKQLFKQLINEISKVPTSKINS